VDLQMDKTLLKCSIDPCKYALLKEKILQKGIVELDCKVKSGDSEIIATFDTTLLECKLSLLSLLTTKQGCELVLELYLKIDIDDDKFLDALIYLEKFKNLNFLCINFLNKKLEMLLGDQLHLLVDVLLSVKEICLLKLYSKDISLFNAILLRLTQSAKPEKLDKIFIFLWHTSSIRDINWALVNECLQKKKLKSVVFMLSNYIDFSHTMSMLENVNQNVIQIEHSVVGAEYDPKIFQYRFKLYLHAMHHWYVVSDFQCLRLTLRKIKV